MRARCRRTERFVQSSLWFAAHTSDSCFAIAHTQSEICLARSLLPFAHLASSLNHLLISHSLFRLPCGSPLLKQCRAYCDTCECTVFCASLSSCCTPTISTCTCYSHWTQLRVFFRTGTGNTSKCCIWSLLKHPLPMDTILSTWT